MIGYGVVFLFGVVLDFGVSFEVGERWVIIVGVEGLDVSFLGEVGGGVGESLGVSDGIVVVLGVDKVRLEVVKVR